MINIRPFEGIAWAATWKIFEVVGTILEAFHHHQLGYMDAYVMHKRLRG
jgi:hypothetical protein